MCDIARFNQSQRESKGDNNLREIVQITDVALDVASFTRNTSATQITPLIACKGNVLAQVSMTIGEMCGRHNKAYAIGSCVQT